jgi:CDP-2,3-bis-(O-geranylgeranyl)-sn-glycerol synthase
MIHDVTFAIWFFVPAAIANVMPIFASKTPGLRHWETPIDGGLRLRGKELFGPHKTVRGFVIGIIAAGLIFWLQQTLVRHIGWVHSFAGGVHYKQLPLVLGPLLGLGALGGDAIESFFKRQHGIESGIKWVPFDQIDYIIGAVLISLPFTILTLSEYVWIFVIWFGIHILSTYIGWLLGLKPTPI